MQGPFVKMAELVTGQTVERAGDNEDTDTDEGESS